MGATGLMSAALATQAITTVSSSYSQAQALKTQGDYQRQQAEMNAKIADFQALDAIKRGDKAAGMAERKSRQLQGSQRAALAAQGLNVDSGSGLELQNDSAELGAIDSATIKNNAWLEAWGYRAQSLDLNSQGQFAQMSANNQASSTLLTGGMSALSSGTAAYSKYKEYKSGINTKDDVTTPYLLGSSTGPYKRYNGL